MDQTPVTNCPSDNFFNRPIPVEGLTSLYPVASEWSKMKTEINTVFSHCSCMCDGRLLERLEWVDEFYMQVDMLN